MIRNTSIFVATFVLGALIALVTRAALYDPHAGRDVHVDDGAATAPMVSNALTPASEKMPDADHQQHADAPRAEAGHADHEASGAPDAGAADATDANAPVNTICAICGMEIDPNLPTATYQGKTIGFGCRMCPPRFKKNPDKYGPYYLRNEVAP